MGPDAFKVRLASTPDARAIAEVHVRAWQWAFRGVIPDSYLDALDESLPRRFREWDEWLTGTGGIETHVAVSGGKVAGFVTVGPSRDGDAAPDTGEVYALYLEKHVQGRGVGRALFVRAQERLRNAGFGQATLWTSEANSLARSFYEKAGWATDGATKPYERPGFTVMNVRYRGKL